MGKVIITEMKDCGMKRVLARGRLMTYCLCCYLTEVFVRGVVEVVVNLMWTEAALLRSSKPPPI